LIDAKIRLYNYLIIAIALIITIRR